VAEFVGRAALLPAKRTSDGVLVTVGSVTLAGPARDDAQPAWEGTVRGRRFAGGHTVYQLRLENGAVVEVMGDGLGAPEGETVRVRLSGQPLATVRA
jgi:hypothetical protein